MNSGLALTIVSVLSGVLIALVTWLGYRQTHRAELHNKDADRIKAIVKAETEVSVTKQQAIEMQIANIIAQHAQLQQQMHEINERQGRILDRLAILETKIEVFWRSVAMDAAKIIHSPDPRRRHIDDLLDEFMDGTINNGQVDELKSILKIMRDWEPGKPSDFPVYPGEQVAAAILLNTIDHARED